MRAAVVAELAPQRPLPLPASDRSETGRTLAATLAGTTAATGTPRRVMMVVAPCAAASRIAAKVRRASSTPLVSACFIAELYHCTDCSQLANPTREMKKGPGFPEPSWNWRARQD